MATKATITIEIAEDETGREARIQVEEGSAVVATDHMLQDGPFGREEIILQIKNILKRVM